MSPGIAEPFSTPSERHAVVTVLSCVVQPVASRACGVLCLGIVNTDNMVASQGRGGHLVPVCGQLTRV